VIDLPYREIWLADFEFRQPDGERPEPACLVAMELRSSRKIRLWRDQFGALPPYPLDANSLFVAFYASAEMSCHRALGWPMPARVLDLFTEFRDLTNGKRALDGGFQKASLLEAMAYFGLAHIAPVEKATMRDKFISGKDFDLWTPEEREEGLDYCETDVTALAGLLPAMLPRIDLHRALIRGEYSGPAISLMQHNGVPVDTQSLQFVLDNWAGIIDVLIARIDVRYGVYDGRAFKEKRFEEYLKQHRIPWERTKPSSNAPNGHLKLDDDTFAQACKAFPSLHPLRNLRHSLGSMRLNAIPIGHDGPVHAPAFRIAHRTQSAVDSGVHFQPGSVAPIFHQSTAGPRDRVCRLERSRVRDRCVSLWRRNYDGRLSDRRSAYQVCKRRWCGTTRRHKGHA
jgi:DNA polymerase I